MRRLALGCAVTSMAVATACAASTTGPRAEVTPTPPTTPETPSPTPSAGTTATPGPSPTASAHSGSDVVAAGAKTPSCVNGWVQPAPGSDFYRQAVSALEQSQGGSGYSVRTVRYFAGPLAGGGIGAIYYLDVNDPRLATRVLLVSGAGPSTAAVAPSGTHGWKAGDWKGFRGSEPAAAHPPLPGRWGGPEFDPVSGSSALLTPAVAGCMAGT